MLIYLYMIDTPEDKEKFKCLYMTYRKKMIVIADNILHDTYEAEDAVQDAFFSIARNIIRINEVDSSQTIGYIMVMAKNAAYDILRKQKKIYTEPANNDMADNELDNALNQLCSKETYEQIVEIIRGLDDVYRSVLYLHFVEQCTAPEIARILGRKLSTVKTQLIRGKKILIEIIRKELGIK
ncbi:hypothetical protein SDC9_112700 [bioreactor metagenome]|uniref:ECF RNA polymerase sigma factor SigW n=1 Tax=bioreactor metagenome TaxID=1076179 RepID=A0A645BL11_9ZZZZ|nr:sigma-70 family RNA polymerase sigma factor [Oscillospiraceae bacterium]